MIKANVAEREFNFGVYQRYGLKRAPLLRTPLQ